MKVSIIITSLILLFGTPVLAQKDSKEKIKFGNITIHDFEPEYKMLDSNANAVILYDGGFAKYEGNNEGWFNIIYTYHKRILILNKNAFALATVEIPLYKGEKKDDDLEKLEAATYIVENGIVNKTKVNKSSIFNDKATKDYSLKKLTFPNVKEGCIVEYTYKIISSRTSYLRGFYFQDKYPIIKSEYDITVPPLFNFIFLSTGSYNLTPTEVNQIFQSYYIVNRGSGAYSSSNNFNYNANNVHSKWVLTNVAPIVRENYTTALKNHIAHIDFQLNSLNYPNDVPKPILQTWAQATKQLLEDVEFGLCLSEKNKWLEDDLEKLIINNDTLTTAKNIFNYIKNNFTCTDYDALYMKETLKKVFETKKGNIIEINMLLTAMLKKAHIAADPLLLSTRENGLAYESYPLLNKFNYLITKTNIAGKAYLLDASLKKIGFNHLSEACYNGYARAINNEKPFLTDLNADSLHETKLTSIFIINSEKNRKMEGSFSSSLGNMESYNLREKMASSNLDEYFKNIKTSYGFNILMNNTKIDSLQNCEQNATISYDFVFDVSDDIIYYNPLLTESYKTNPFTATKRNYPIEMPYTTNEIININIEIPKGYRVDEVPKSIKVKLNEVDGNFDYVVQADATNVQILCKIAINKANFDAEDYDSLRDFYSYIIKKQGEVIVFKKTN